MSSAAIGHFQGQDVRFTLGQGAGSDALHSNLQYSLAEPRSLTPAPIMVRTFLREWCTGRALMNSSGGGISPVAGSTPRLC